MSFFFIYFSIVDIKILCLEGKRRRFERNQEDKVHKDNFTEIKAKKSINHEDDVQSFLRFKIVLKL